ncbi:MAG: CRISPR-associated endonuclease Cas2 [Patescibacteria group bacterium]
MKARYGGITKDALLILAGVGLLAVAATSPFFLINIARGFIKYKRYNKDGDRNINEARLAKSLGGLNKNKIIIIREEKDKFTVRLTEKGKKVVKEILFAGMNIEKQKIWDKKWRIVIFDIPERKRRHMRDAMRQKLQTIGFYQLQKSVWVHPYPCEKEIQLLCEVFEINPFVNIITAEKIYNDDILLKHFKLSR